MAILTKINTRNIADNAITADKMVAGAVTADIAVDSITGSHIENNPTIEGNLTSTGAFQASSTSALQGVVTVGSGGTSWTLPSARSSTSKYVLQASDTAGNVDWAQSLTAPITTSISGKLNADNDSTITIHGSNFQNTSLVSIWNASAGGTKHGDATSTTFVSGSKLVSTFGAGVIPDTGTVYVEVSNSGLANRFLTGQAVSTDPASLTFSSTQTPTNFVAGSHLGTYGAPDTKHSEYPDDKYTTYLLQSGNTPPGEARSDGSHNFNADNYLEAGNGLSNGTPRLLEAGNNSWYGIAMPGSPFGDGKTALSFSGASGAYIEFPAAYWNPQAGDWTIDFWAHPQNDDRWGVMGILPDYIFGIERRKGASSSSGGQWVIAYGGGSNWTASGSSHPDNFNDHAEFLHETANSPVSGGRSGRSTNQKQWTHIAVVRKSGNVKLFINGEMEVNKNANISIMDTSSHGSNWRIGFGFHSTVPEMNCHLDEYRLVNGEAIWTKNFRPPTARYDTTSTGSANNAAGNPTNQDNVKLLIRGGKTAASGSVGTTSGGTDGYVKGTATLTVGSGAGVHSLTCVNNGNDEATGSWAPYPANGKRFAATGFHIKPTAGGARYEQDDAFSFGTSDFTIEAWVNLTLSHNNNVDYAIVASQTSSSSPSQTYALISKGASGTMGLLTFNHQGTEYTDVTSTRLTTQGTNNNWWHVAAVREGNALRLYLNGKNVGSWTSAFASNTTCNAPSTGTGIGCYNNTGNDSIDGWLDEVRVSKIARYKGTVATEWGNTLQDGSTPWTQPTKIFRAITAGSSRSIDTITFTGSAGVGGGDVDWSLVTNSGNASGSQHLNDSNLNLTLTDGGVGSNTATLTGTIAAGTGDNTSVTGMKVKAIVSVSDATCDTTNASANVTMDSTAGINPGMTVTGTGIPASTTVSSVTNPTQIVLSANATASNTNTTLRFGDPNRVGYVNGNEDGTGSHLTIATGSGAGGAYPLFNAVRWSGNRPENAVGNNLLGYRSINHVEFQPDLIWHGGVTHNQNWFIHDVLRGGTNWMAEHTSTGRARTLILNGNNQQGNQNQEVYGGMGRILKNGFELRPGSGSPDSDPWIYNNQRNRRYMAYCWKAGGPVYDNSILAAAGQGVFGAGSGFNGLTEGAGSISNTATGISGGLTNIVQTVSQDQGFSITKYSADTTTSYGSGKGMIHGLGATPEFVMVKRLDTSNTDWSIWHHNFSATSGKMITQAAVAESSATAFYGAPTSTLMLFSDHGGVAYNSTYIMYAWRGISGVSKFGTYVGSASNKTVSGLGFKPRFVWIKNRESSNAWTLWDGFRYSSFASPDNLTKTVNTSGAYGEAAGYGTVTITNDGFILDTAWGGINGSAGNNYIYAAFA